MPWGRIRRGARAGRRVSARSSACRPSASGVVVGRARHGQDRHARRARRAPARRAGCRPRRDPGADAVAADRDGAARPARARGLDRATSGPLARSVASFAFQLVRAAAVAAEADPPQLLTGGDEDQHHRTTCSTAMPRTRPTAGGRWPEWLGAGVRGAHGLPHRGAHVPRGVHDARASTPPRCARSASAHGLAGVGALASFFAEYLEVRAGMRGAHRDAAGLVREAVGLLAHRAARASRRSTACGSCSSTTRRSSRSAASSCSRRAAGAGSRCWPSATPTSAPARSAAPPRELRAAGRARSARRAVLDRPHRGTPWQGELVRRVTAAHRRGRRRRAPRGARRCRGRRIGARRSRCAPPPRSTTRSRGCCASGTCTTASRGATARSSPTTPGRSRPSRPSSSAREVPARSSGPGRPLGVLRPVRDLLRLVDLATPRRMDVRGRVRGARRHLRRASTRSSCAGCARRCAMPPAARRGWRQSGPRCRRAASCCSRRCASRSSST